MGFVPRSHRYSKNCLGTSEKLNYLPFVLSVSKDELLHFNTLTVYGSTSSPRTVNFSEVPLMSYC